MSSPTLTQPPSTRLLARARRLLVALVSGFALVLGLMLSATTPAHAAPARNDSRNETIYFVHGYDAFGVTPGHDCGSYFGAAKTKLRSLGWTGAFTTIAFYTGDTGCSTRIGSYGRDTSIKELGKKLAWDIYNKHSRYGRSVDVLAHSMGGLVIRAAITGTARKESGFPPYLYVEDVVTLGTPHNGAKWAAPINRQVSEMTVGSSLLKWLYQNAQANGGTDWTLIGSEDDDTVDVESATVESRAGHYVWYYARQGLEHNDLQKNVSGTYRNKYKNYYQTSWVYQSSGRNVIHTAYAALYYYWRW